MLQTFAEFWVVFCFIVWRHSSCPYYNSFRTTCALAWRRAPVVCYCVFSVTSHRHGNNFLVGASCAGTQLGVRIVQLLPLIVSASQFSISCLIYTVKCTDWATDSPGAMLKVGWRHYSPEGASYEGIFHWKHIRLIYHDCGLAFLLKRNHLRKNQQTSQQTWSPTQLITRATSTTYKH